jgi:Tol biopolymer transport system component
VNLALNSGTRFGSYEIVAPLGSGGMGEVYRARDGRLNREVAIKVLPSSFAADADRLARFRREAQVLAALNHPQIAAIYGLEESGDVEAIVLELVPGETLAERLAKGPLPVDEALDVARQIAEALEAAHERGIVHRDLKPANVKRTPEGKVKVLDFGLAKALAADASSPDVSHSPTLTAQATQAGVVIGTAAYMSPEQARGKSVDKRADIWAWGCLLYETLTGKRAFEGETVSDTLASVLRGEIDWAALPSETPSSVRSVLKRCLDRDTRTRIHDIADARIEMESREPAPPPSLPVPPSRGPWRGLALFAAGAIVAAAAVLLLHRPPAPSARIRRFALGRLNLIIDWKQGLAISPDGSNLVYRGRGEDGVERLYLRTLDSLEPKALPGTEQAGQPFFSPDGEWIGFFAPGSMKKVALSGGSPQVVCRSSAVPGGGTWLPDGTILFVNDVYSGVQRVPAGGGTPQDVLTLDPKSGMTSITTPWALPGGKGVLYAVRKGEGFGIAVSSLDGRDLKMLVDDGYSPVYADGFVFFQQGQGNAVLALPFDVNRLAATGPAVPTLSEIGTRVSFQTRMFALAADGTMAYIPRASGLQRGSLVWVDRKGVPTPIVEIPRLLDAPRVSPDGTHIAFRAPAPNCDIWVHDIARGATTRLTLEGDNHGVVWMPDSKRIAFARQHGGVAQILAQSTDGTGRVDVLVKAGSGSEFLSSGSPDGNLLLASQGGRTTGLDVELLAVGKDSDDARRPLIHSPFDEYEATFSPDGRWIAYVSNESGRPEVYLQPYPAMDSRQQISTDGGIEPVWSRTGKELFFRQGRKMLAVEVRLAPTLSVDRPKVLFEGNYLEGANVADYDVGPDGRFVMIGGRESGGNDVVVVLNWLRELRGMRGVARGN